MLVYWLGGALAAAALAGGLGWWRALIYKDEWDHDANELVKALSDLRVESMERRRLGKLLDAAQADVRHWQEAARDAESQAAAINKSLTDAQGEGDRWRAAAKAAERRADELARRLDRVTAAAAGE